MIIVLNGVSDHLTKDALDDEKLCKCGRSKLFHSKKSIRKLYEKSMGGVLSNWDDFIDRQHANHKFRQMRCSACDKELRTSLDKYDYNRKYYCISHCPEHKWQYDTGQAPQCAHCGIDYDRYIESLLEKHKIAFLKYEP